MNMLSEISQAKHDKKDGRILYICGTTKVGHVEAEQMAWLPEGNGWRSVKDMLAKEFSISI